MTRLALLSDRQAEEVLPAVGSTGWDLKVLPLDVESLVNVPDLGAKAILADAVVDAERAYGVLSSLAAAGSPLPVVIVADPSGQGSPAWEHVADEVISPEAGGTEARLRLAMVLRRIGGDSEGAVRLGRLSLSPDTYQVAVDGRPMDLTYKEFELLRFLASRPGRVFTRAALLREVWGFDFYGGTRTVDVHVRRLRAKLGPEHENLIETVRGVGYRAADPSPG